MLLVYYTATAAMPAMLQVRNRQPLLHLLLTAT
jgi:hypothetical protein